MISLSLRNLEKYCIKKDNGIMRYDNEIFSLQKKRKKNSQTQ